MEYDEKQRKISLFDHMVHDTNLRVINGYI